MEYQDLQVLSLMTIFCIGIVCFLMLNNLRRFNCISEKIFYTLCVTGVLSFGVQALIVLKLSTSEIISFQLFGMSGSWWWFWCTMLGWVAFAMIAVMSRKNWLHKYTFAALALVGQVTYPLFLFGMLIGQGGQW